MSKKRELMNRMSETMSEKRGIATLISSNSEDSFIATFKGVAFKVTLEEIGEVEREETLISDELTQELFALSKKVLK